jgi:hypothetical protein
MKSLDDILYTKNDSIGAYSNTYIDYQVESFGDFIATNSILSHSTLKLTKDNRIIGYISNLGWHNQYIYYYDRENRVSTSVIGIYVYDNPVQPTCEDYFYSSTSNFSCGNNHQVVSVRVNDLNCYRCEPKSSSSSSSSSSKQKCIDYGYFDNPLIMCFQENTQTGVQVILILINGLKCYKCPNKRFKI